MDDHSDCLSPYKIKRWGKRIWIENTTTKEEFYHGDATPFWYKMLGNERNKMNSKNKLNAPWKSRKVDTQ